MRGQQLLLSASVRIRARPDEWTAHCALALLAAAGLGELAVGEGLDCALTTDEVRQSLLFEQADVGDSHFEALSRSIAKLNPDAKVVRNPSAEPTLDIDIGANARDTLSEGMIHGAAVATETILAIASPADRTTQKRGEP